MSRRRAAEKRQLKPDTKYNDVLVSKFINKLMKDGKKGIAEKIFYASIEAVTARLSADDPMLVFHGLLENVKPKLEVRSRRVGGSTYQIPVEVKNDRKEALAIRWLVAASRARSGKSMVENLSAEFFEASNGRGNAVKKREDVNKMAEANRAFAHFAN